MTQAIELDWGPLQEELSKQLTFTLRLLKDLNKVGEQDEEYSAKCRAASQHHFNLYLSHVRMSLHQRHSYSGSYIRNFMWALTTTGCEGADSYEHFINNFQNPVFVTGNNIIKKDLYPQQQDQQFELAQKFDRYMQLLVSLYTNRLLNLIDGIGRHEVSQDDERWIELTDLHHQYERDFALDEIYMIRTQFIWTLVGSHPQLLKDEGKRTEFQQKALEVLNEINLKAQS